MARTTIFPAQEPLKDGGYVTEYLKWKGFYDDIPILKSILDTNGAAVAASWRTSGTNSIEMAAILDKFNGSGKQTFKSMMYNTLVTCKLGGNAYFEILYDGDDVENIIMLNPDSIRVIIKNGRIKRYEQMVDTTGDTTKWKPEEILHFPYNSIGAMPYGQSSIAPMNDLLLSLRQVQDDMKRIFHRYVKPTRVVEIDTDNVSERQDVESELKKVFRTQEADIFADMGKIKISNSSVPQFSTLDPASWHKIIMDQLIMSSRVPELALGTGSVNSEESAKMQFDGFRQMVRWDQKFLEDVLEHQLFPQMFPEDTPKIKFSFAAEPQEEKYNRLQSTLQAVNGSELNDSLKGLLLIKILGEMGLIEDV